MAWHSNSSPSSRSLPLIRACAVVLVAALVLVSALPAQAIVIRHDRADSRYIVDAARYPQLFYLHTRYANRVCMATLIAPQWAITAAHCTEETPIGATLANAETYALEIAGKPYQIDALVVHPDYRSGPLLSGTDLALLRLDSPVPERIKPIRLYREQNENALVATLLGWGHTGIGTTGRNRNDGKFRRANNAVSEANAWLRFRFDDPRDANSAALNLEGIPGLGDSGSPAFAETSDGLLLMGVALGEIENADDRSRQGLYGAIEIYERISQHLGWIDSHIGSPGNSQSNIVQFSGAP